MFYGLSTLEEEFYADSLLKFAAFAPCIRFAEDKYGDARLWKRSQFKYEPMGIYHEGGLYQFQNLEKICTQMPLHCKDAARWIIAQPSSVQSSLHYAQCSIEQRFQEFKQDYQVGDKTDEIPLSTVDKVPIAMWVGEQDHLCDQAQAEVIRDTIGDAVKYWKTLPDFTHVSFASANSEDFVNDVVNQLKTGYERPQQFLQ